MNKFVLLISAVAFAGCGDKENSSPKIPDNSAAVKINGVAFPIDLSKSEVIVTNQTSDLLVILRTSQGINGPRVLMQLDEFNKRAEKVNLSTQSTSVIALDETPTGGPQHGSRDCDPVNRSIEIVSYDEAKRTVSGRFSGNLCSTMRGPVTKTASEGEFNLPFKLQ
ncbi:hypothetical protein [Hymenobacter koreensis]|uniref:Lipoprotein n=1 Tax=Hymenobacter koreensis TaxID=1084523 RepID=A0ABP8J0T3_9BACT